MHTYIDSDMSLFRVPKGFVKRKYDESVISYYRTEFMRDRDRVMYATAFRRLAGKTQIYTVGTDDHKRNRLTHTLEVSQIARTIAKALFLDEELTEAIALAHDFGHTPFGHAGEEELHKIMIPNSQLIKTSPFFQTNLEQIEDRFELEANDNIDYLKYAFGFKHNLQSVRVASVLEDSYRDDDGNNIGLNLTNYTLYGMMIHSNLTYKKERIQPNYQLAFDENLKINDSDKDAWSFEAYIVAMADEFSQWHHDLEDALRGGALPLNTICKTISDSLNLSPSDKKLLSDIAKNNAMNRKYLADLSHLVVNSLVNDLVETSQENFLKIRTELRTKGITTAEEVFLRYDELGLSLPKDKIIVNSEAIKSDGFKKTIKKSVHHSRNVERMNSKGQYIIRKLFEAYSHHPQQLPDGPILHLLVDAAVPGYENLDEARGKGYGQIRVDFDNKMKNPSIYFQSLLMRRICDHIASMTDRYAIEEYNNLYG